jgi:hypothetical protein
MYLRWSGSQSAHALKESLSCAATPLCCTLLAFKMNAVVGVCLITERAVLAVVP